MLIVTFFIDQLSVIRQSVVLLIVVVPYYGMGRATWIEKREK
jgi:hypothetical protein